MSQITLSSPAIPIFLKICRRAAFQVRHFPILMFFLEGLDHLLHLVQLLRYSTIYNDGAHLVITEKLFLCIIC